MAFNQFVNPWALKAIAWRYYTVYCGWLVLELLFVFFFVVETKGEWSLGHAEESKISNGMGVAGRTLEETAALFDGDQKPNDLVVMGGAAASEGIRYTTVVSVVVDEPETINAKSITDKHEEYYHMKRQYQDSDSTSSSTITMHARAC